MTLLEDLGMPVMAYKQLEVEQRLKLELEEVKEVVMTGRVTLRQIGTALRRMGILISLTNCCMLNQCCCVCSTLLETLSGKQSVRGLGLMKQTVMKMLTIRMKIIMMMTMMVTCWMKI